MDARDKVELEILAKTGRPDIAEQVGSSIAATIVEAAEKMGIDPDKLVTNVEVTVIRVGVDDEEEEVD